MSPALAAFIVVMTAIVVFGGIATTWIRTHAASAAPRGDRLDRDRQIELLSAENAGLKGQVGRLEERIAVLERIATGPAERTAQEIEKLR